LNGAVGAVYRLEFATNVFPPGAWTPVLTQMLTTPTAIFSNTRPALTGRGFYRVGLVP
jgi:hypothetical protein